LRRILYPLVHQSMKNAAICDTWCELQPQAIVNHRIFERTAPPLRDGIPVWWMVLKVQNLDSSSAVGIELGLNLGF